MVTKAQFKHIQLLADKKYRREHKQFVVEGEKMVAELLSSSLTIDILYALPEWIEANAAIHHHYPVVTVAYFELEKMSSFKTPNQVLAIVSMPVWTEPPFTWALLLDGIQDPGNFGSIIRIADWYGISAVYRTELCADPFNHKVIQASMGSIFRIPVHSVDPVQFLQQQAEIPKYAAVLQGTDVHNLQTSEKGILIIGNESKGIQDELLALSSHRISIPSRGKAESLNAAVATGILCDVILSKS